MWVWDWICIHSKVSPPNCPQLHRVFFVYVILSLCLCEVHLLSVQNKVVHIAEEHTMTCPIQWQCTNCWKSIEYTHTHKPQHRSSPLENGWMARKKTHVSNRARTKRSHSVRFTDPFAPTPAMSSVYPELRSFAWASYATRAPRRILLWMFVRTCVRYGECICHCIPYQSRCEQITERTSTDCN